MTVFIKFILSLLIILFGNDIAPTTNLIYSAVRTVLTYALEGVSIVYPKDYIIDCIEISMEIVYNTTV